MPTTDSNIRFKAKLRKPANPGKGSSWGFVVLPRDASKALPRRGRTTIDGTINGHPFQATLEPDGQLSHWLKVNRPLREAARADFGDMVALVIRPVEQEPEPSVPADLKKALAASPDAQTTWSDTTALARVDWVHWITSAKQSATRARRVANACDMLASGKRRVCCFDPSGYYDKSLSAPEAAE